MASNRFHLSVQKLESAFRIMTFKFDARQHIEGSVEFPHRCHGILFSIFSSISLSSSARSWRSDGSQTIGRTTQLVDPLISLWDNPSKPPRIGGLAPRQDVQNAKSLPKKQAASQATSHILQPDWLRSSRGVAAPPSSICRLRPVLPPRPLLPAGVQGNHR
jgi:hypothetical protein